MTKKRLVLMFLALTLLCGCSFPGLGKSAKEAGVVIAGGNTTERQILAEITSQMVKHYMPNTSPTLINNLGSTVLVLQALQRNDANAASAMYTGTSLTGELGLPPTTDPEKAMEQVVNGYSKQFDMVWFPSYGFENTYAFMVSRSLAEKYDLKKVSDLSPYASTLKVGVDIAWIDRQGDGYQDFKRLYEFDFKQVSPMEIGLVYQAVYANKMDIVLGYSTDGRIASYDLVLLEDDKHLFPPYETSPLTSKQLLREHPEIETIFLKLEGEITSNIMQELNRLSDEEHLEPYTVAKQFLDDRNFFEDKKVTPLFERTLYKTIVSDILPLTGKEK